MHKLSRRDLARGMARYLAVGGLASGLAPLDGLVNLVGGLRGGTLYARIVDFHPEVSRVGA